MKNTNIIREKKTAQKVLYAVLKKSCVYSEWEVINYLSFWDLEMNLKGVEEYEKYYHSGMEKVFQGEAWKKKKWNALMYFFIKKKKEEDI